VCDRHEAFALAAGDLIFIMPSLTAALLFMYFHKTLQIAHF